MSTQVQKQAKQNNYLGMETEVAKVFKRAKTNMHTKCKMVVTVGQGGKGRGPRKGTQIYKVRIMLF